MSDLIGDVIVGHRSDISCLYRTCEGLWGSFTALTIYFLPIMKPCLIFLMYLLKLLYI